ncbi:MAG: hypothetical protein ACE15F_12735 [bacterium]
MMDDYDGCRLKNQYMTILVKIQVWFSGKKSGLIVSAGGCWDGGVGKRIYGFHARGRGEWFSMKGVALHRREMAR